MEIILSGRHMELSDELHQYAEGKFAALTEEYSKLTTLRLVLEMERGWHLAEGHLTGKNVDLEAEARTRDMYVSLDEVYEKLHKQLRKRLDKTIQNHRDSQRMAETIKDQMPGLASEEETETEE